MLIDASSRRMLNIITEVYHYINSTHHPKDARVELFPRTRRHLSRRVFNMMAPHARVPAWQKLSDVSALVALLRKSQWKVLLRIITINQRAFENHPCKSKHF
jgi:hypothetical protein